jgi:hypothetical protein
MSKLAKLIAACLALNLFFMGLNFSLGSFISGTMNLLAALGLGYVLFRSR